MAPIEKPKTGPDLKSPVELDRLSADVQKVQRALDRAAGYIGGEVYERWNKNAGRREIVTAVAETLPDGRTRFLPAGTEGKLQLVRPEFLRRPEELIRIRAALSQEVIDGQKQLDALIAELEGARGTVPEAAQAMEYLRTAKIQDVDTAVEAHFTAWDAALGNAERAAEQSATDTEFLAKLPDIQSYLTPEQLGGAPADQPLGQGLVENVKLAINIFFIEEMRKKLHPSMNLEELGKIQAKLKEQAVAVQQERRLYIAQHSPERERYLHLLGGGTAQEIIEQSKMEPGTENSAVDIELLAAHLTGISRGAVSLDALKQVIAASNIVNLKRQIDAGTLMVALTKDEQAQLADILQEKFHVANPAGISIPELLNRANYPKEFLEKFRAVTEEIPVGMIVSLAKIPVAEWNAQPRSGATCKKLAELCAVPTTIPERTGAYWQIDFDALRDLLVGLNLPDTTLTDADVRVAQEKADAEIRILRSKPMSVIDGKQFMGEEAFFSSLGALQPQTLLSNLSKNPPITAADFPLSERLKMKGNELGETIRYGTEAWWKYIKSLPRIVERDPALLEILDRQRAIGSALHAVDAALQMTDTSTQTAADAKGAMQETQRGREEALRRVPASDRPYAHFREARDLLAVSDEIFQQLDRDYSLSERFSLEEQRMAFWIALQKDVRTAGEYLNTPPAQRSAFLRKLFPSPELGSIAMRNFTQRSTVQERLSGKDVLQPLRTELHVKILAPALALLSGTLGPDGEPLSIDESRISAWMTDPAHAGPALRTILVSEEDAPGNVEALVLAFTENREQRCTFFNPDGTSQERALTPEQARAYIAEVQKHLLQQSRDLQRSTQQAATSERFKNPIEMLRGGAEAIAEMISSGDRVKQGLALTMLVAGGYALYKGWKRGGWTRRLLVGIPLFFGADMVMQNMTGKGILDRLGLKYMSPEDKGTAYEQFMRRNQGLEKYAYMKTEAGQEAVRVLMDQKCQVPVSHLLLWRKYIRANGTENYEYTADRDLLAPLVRKVKGKMGTTEKGDSKVRTELAYRYLYQAFDALCEDVGESNAMGRNADIGAEIIRRRYVDFDEDFYPDTARAALKDSSSTMGGFNMLQVLVCERPTPAMQEQLMENPTFLEWIARGTGIATEKLLGGLRAGKTLAQTVVAEGASRMPEAAGKAWEWTSETSKDIYDWMRTTWGKGNPEVKEDVQAGWRLIAESLGSAGIIIRDNVPAIAESAYEHGTVVASKTVDALRDAYRVLQANGISGQAIDGIDSLLLSCTGYTGSELFLQESALTERNTEKQVEELSLYEGDKKWRATFMEQLKAFAKDAPNEALVDAWVDAATEELYAGKKLTDLDAFGKMAVYELVKRRVYSFLLERRLVEVETIASDRSGTLRLQYPLVVPWKGWNELQAGKYAKDIQSAYGLPVLALLGSEPTKVFGNFERYIQRHPTGAMKDTLEVIFAGVDWIKRDEATEYLSAVNEYHAMFMRRAGNLLPEGPDKEAKLKAYDAFLQTLLTNAVIDRTLRQQEARSGLPTSRMSASEGHGDPLAVTIREAQDFLEYLRVTRGMSADFDHLKGMDFKAFAPADASPSLTNVLNDEALMARIKALHPESASLPVAPAGAPAAVPALAPVPANIDAMLQDPATKPEHLISAIGTSMNPQQELAFRTKFDQAADQLLPKNLTVPEERKEALLVLEGASVAKVEELQKALVRKNMNALMELVQQAAAYRDGPAKNPAPIQRLVDMGITVETHKLLKQIAAVSIENLPTHAERNTWESKLLQLYKLSYTGTPTRMTDMVSALLEYVLYRMKENSKPDAQGLTHFKKYEAYLQSKGLVAPSDAEYRFGASSWYWGNKYMGSKERMQLSGNVTEGYLQAMGDSPINRIEGLEEDLKIKDIAATLP